MTRKPQPTPEQIAWLDQCEAIRAIDVRDLGLPFEENHPIKDSGDLLDLFAGIDNEGRAL